MPGKRIDLLGVGSKEPVDRAQLIKVGALVGVVVLAGLAGLTYLKQGQVDDEKSKLSDAVAKNTVLQTKIDALSAVGQRQTQIETLSTETQALLANDVSWSSLLQAISRTIPSDVWLTSFQGTVTQAAAAAAAPTPAPAPAAGGSTDTTPPAPVTPAPVVASGPSGTVNFSASARDFDAVAKWIQRIGADIPSFTDLWVPNASKATSAGSGSTTGGASSSSTGSGTVTFSSTATITPAAKSKRDEDYKVTP